MFTVIYKPTVECNLRCKYCYLNLRDYQKKIGNKEYSTVVFSKILENLLKLENKNVNFIFHGGEPLLMGHTFWEKILKILAAYEINYNFSIKKSMQTNLLLLDERYCELFKEYEVRLSTSIDGTEKAHDYYRRNIKGVGSWNQLQSKIQDCKKFNLPINAVCVVNPMNYKEAPQVYKYFNDNEISIRINHLTIEDQNFSDDFFLPDLSYGKFVNEISDIWFNDYESKIEVQPLSEMFTSLHLGVVESCIFSNDCQKYFTAVGPNGEIWTCGKSVGMNEHTNANIFSDSFLWQESKSNKNLFRNGVIPKQCLGCQFNSVCRGGCPLDSVFTGGEVLQPTSYCKDYLAIWDHISKFYLPIAENI